MDTILLSVEKLTVLLGCRGWPSFDHALVLMEPDASHVRLVELLSSIRMAAGLRMVAPVISADSA